jgi:hypothetical protein
MIAAIRLQSRMRGFRKNINNRDIRDIGDRVLLTIRLQTNKLSESDFFIVRLQDCQSQNADFMSNATFQATRLQE